MELPFNEQELLELQDFKRKFNIHDSYGSLADYEAVHYTYDNESKYCETYKIIQALKKLVLIQEYFNDFSKEDQCTLLLMELVDEGN